MAGGVCHIEAKRDTREAVRSIVQATLGTMVEINAPLMSAGLDSLSVAELVNALSVRLDTELAPTDLFDYPTLDSIVSLLLAEPIVDDDPMAAGKTSSSGLRSVP